MKSHTIVRVVVALFIAAAIACGKESGPTDPKRAEVTQKLEVSNLFAPASSITTGERLLSFASSAIDIRRIRVSVYEVATGTRAFQQTYDVDPTQSKWVVPFTAPAGVQIRLVVELISVDSGVETVQYSGQTTLTLQPCTTDCPVIPVKTYPGPVENLSASSVTVSPKTRNVAEGDTVRIGTTISPTGSYTVMWSSANPAVATVTSTGVVKGVAAGSTRIIAAVGPRADTAVITVEAVNGCIVRPYTLGTTADGVWTESDCLAASGSGRHFDMYEFSITQQTAFRAQITGPSGRRVNLRRSGTQDYVQVMASNDFMPPTSNPLEVRYILAPGSYVFEIATPDAATLGSYSLKTFADAGGGCNPITFVTSGITVTDQIAGPNDCTGPGGGKEDRFIILPPAGLRLDMSVATTAFAPILVFRDDREGPASPTLASDNRTSVGATARVAYTTTFAGFHEIVVAHSNGGASGAYTLTIGTASAANTCVPINTAVAGSRLSKWESSDCRAEGLYDSYAFTLPAPAAVRGVLSSSAAPKTLGIYKAGSEVLDWSRASGGDLAAVWYLPAGDYEMRAGAAAGSAESQYSLVTSQVSDDIGCANNGALGPVTFSNQTLGDSDCSFNGRYEDRVAVIAEAGVEIVARMTATFGSSVIIRDPASTPGTFLKIGEAAPGATAEARFVAPVTGYYQVIFSSGPQGATGTYSGSIGATRR